MIRAKYKHSLIFWVFLLLQFLSFAQHHVTFVIENVPAYTPQDAKIIAAGEMNTWNPADSNYVFQKQNGQYILSFNTSLVTFDYKLTRGSWASVEGNQNGTFRPNRTYIKSLGDTAFLNVLSCEDLHSQQPGGTATANVQILSPNFSIPQLNRSRRIWLYLPPDYRDTNKDYPVIYMHDGQNLFDASTSFAGEWQIDETLNQLFQNGDSGVIVVGIDNGGAARMNEYAPWVNAQYNAGGEGQLYMEFIVNTLKPYIDSNFRTKTERTHTALFGSSLGALVSLYGTLLFEDVFSKAGLFSPAYWFNPEIQDFASEHIKSHDFRLYHLIGGQEGASVADQTQAMHNNLLDAGFESKELYIKTNPIGTHSESFWRTEFASAYQWLFADTSETPSSIEEIVLGVKLFPNPFSKFLNVQHKEGGDVQVKIYDTQGRLMHFDIVYGSGQINTQHLSSGIYFVEMKVKGRSFKKVMIKR